LPSISASDLIVNATEVSKLTNMLASGSDDPYASSQKTDDPGRMYEYIHRTNASRSPLKRSASARLSWMKMKGEEPRKV